MNVATGNPCTDRHPRFQGFDDSWSLSRRLFLFCSKLPAFEVPSPNASPEKSPLHTSGIFSRGWISLALPRLGNCVLLYGCRATLIPSSNVPSVVSRQEHSRFSCNVSTGPLLSSDSGWNNTALSSPEGSVSKRRV